MAYEYHNKAVILKSNKVNLQNQNCSNTKAPQYLLTSDQGSPQITCVGYWVTFFINEQSLPRVSPGSSTGCGVSTAPYRAQGPSLMRGLGIGVTVVL